MITTGMMNLIALSAMERLELDILEAYQRLVFEPTPRGNAFSASSKVIHSILVLPSWRIRCLPIWFPIQKGVLVMAAIAT